MKTAGDYSESEPKLRNIRSRWNVKLLSVKSNGTRDFRCPSEELKQSIVRNPGVGDSCAGEDAMVFVCTEKSL
jgi:hypothetical protein